MAKGRSQKQQGHAAAPKDNHVLKAKAAPLKHSKKEAVTVSKPSPTVQASPRRGAANNFQKGAAKHATHAADGEEQHRLRALRQVNMGPSDEDMSEDESGTNSGSDSGEDSREQNEKGPGNDREAYERALRRMEMGPSDEEEDESSGGGSGMDDDEDDDEGDGSSDSESGDGDSRGRLRGAGPSKEESSKGGMQSGASGLRGMGYYEGSSEGEEGESSSEGEGDEVGHGKVPKVTLPSQQQQLQQQRRVTTAAGKEPNEHQGDEGSSSDEHSDSEGEEEEQDEEAAFLAELPLGERLALRTDGSGPDGNAARAAAAKAREAERSFKRANKHRPHEASSKKPVPRLREIIQPSQRPGRDPRFAPAQTQAERDAAAKRYSFVYDDMLPQDRNRIKAQLKQTHNERARTALSAQLQRVEQAMRAEQDRRRQEKIESDWKAKERGALEGGAKTKPFYLKKGEKKKMALMARFQELKEKGQLDKYMEKRRKRNASKDHKRIPSAGRS
ncbi:hypothetical protein DUNSADRAFT_6909 [Dunaliella salina]|uniref:rRNA biogenesis protein RRP36 n=1 Tax=Dunaliella salina TaxID=3046 RepID=A0ABQ7GMD0_DUNSA|nr:hypothetical protein DUNSADRAFT_6909 [Dunaliella salina]|eukprot:KAF5835769.1 hypothetical protein DUNSADRAFT_6909 [Dunaliella salina]